MEKNFDVFISYRRSGGASTARLLYEKVKKMGYSVFLDTEKLSVGAFNEQLYEVIDNCRTFILILPEHALDRCADETDWVRLEIERAIKQNKKIIPIWLENFELPKELPKSLN